jgi:hypothetical protein
VPSWLVGLDADGLPAGGCPMRFIVENIELLLGRFGVGLVLLWSALRTRRGVMPHGSPRAAAGMLLALGGSELGVVLAGEDGAEALDDVWVELAAGAPSQLGDRPVFVHCSVVGAVGCHRVECVADGDDPRAERDVVCCERVWVAGSVVVFVG